MFTIEDPRQVISLPVYILSSLASSFNAQIVDVYNADEWGGAAKIEIETDL